MYSGSLLLFYCLNILFSNCSFYIVKSKWARQEKKKCDIVMLWEHFPGMVGFTCSIILLILKDFPLSMLLQSLPLLQEGSKRPSPSVCDWF